ncbi:LysR family transcriptional regulator [Orbaceae bacterium ac157xtp]
MDIKKIRSFLVLAGCHSYHEASNKLNITQPTLSKQIQILEQRLGFQLFYRDNQGTHLTDAGKTIYKHAVDLNNQLDKFFCIAKKIQNGKIDNINIGYTFSFLKILPKFINAYNSLYPMININAYELGSDIQEEKLINGELDIGLMDKPKNRDLLLDFVEIDSDSLMLVSNDNSDLESLDNKKLCLPSHNTNAEIANKINQFLLKNISPNIQIQYIDTIYSIMSLIELNSNVTILPTSIIDINSSKIKTKKFTGKSSKWKIGLVRNKANINPNITTFIEDAKKIAKMMPI